MKPNETLFHNKSAEQIKAAVCFEYRGYEISISSIPNHVEMMVFRGDENGSEVMMDLFGNRSPLTGNAENIRLAMEYIDLLDG